MNRTYHYYAKARTGASHTFDVEERDESIANVQAKIAVERWMRSLGLNIDDHTAFDLTFVAP